MTNPFTVRPETTADRTQVAAILARTYLAEGAEVIALVGDLRGAPGFNPALSLVGVIEDKVAGFALLTPVTVGETPRAALLLAPIAIDTQNPAATPAPWVEAVLAEVARQGYRYVLVKGQPDLYLPQGFVPAADKGVTGAPSDDALPLLVKDITPQITTTLSGKVVYPHA